MPSIASNANERRRQQNREAQRKRRESVKSQIQELQADNEELRAFQEIVLRAAKRSSTYIPEIENTNRHGRPSSRSNSVLSQSPDRDKEVLSPIVKSRFPDYGDDFLNEMAATKAYMGTLEMNPSMDMQFQQHRMNDMVQLLPSPTIDPWGAGCKSAEVLQPTLPVYPPKSIPGPKIGRAGDINDIPQTGTIPSGSESIYNSSPESLVPTQSLVDMSSSTGSSASRRHSLDRSRRSSQRDGRQEAMNLAIRNGHVPMVTLLIRHGADVDAQDEIGRTPLHGAAEANSGKLAELLLENHADLNVVDNSGMTALQIAASLGHMEVAEVLLRYVAS